MTTDKMRVAIYVRVSTQEQAKEGYSIGEQTERLTLFAKAHDWNIVKVYTDAGHSGANTDRPALQDLLSDVRAGSIDKVLVYKLDRLSRSQKDTLKLIEDEFIPNNTDFESMSEKLDTSTAQGRLFLGILAAFAQLEREMIKERMQMGMSARIKEGKWKGAGGHLPFGYDYDPDQEKLVINPYEGMIVKDLFKRCAAGESLNSIANDMVRTGRTFTSGKVDKRNLRYILRNKVYCGYQRHKGEWYECNHEPIIDEETYNKCQVLLDENKRRFEETGYKSGTANTSTVLGGLIYCARCGAKYSKYQSGTKKYGYKYHYGCYSRHKKLKPMIIDPNCKNKNYGIDELDNIIFDQIKKLALDPDYIRQLKKESGKEDVSAQITAIEKQIRTISAQLSRFMDLYSLGTFTIDELDQKTKPLAEQRIRLHHELERLQESTSTMTEDQVIDAVQSFEEALKHGDLQQKRTIVSKLINKIIIDGDDITIHWNFT